MDKYNDITEENIKVLVDRFYGKVVKDEYLGPVFNNAIKDWPPHLEKMYSFWSSIMLGSKTYTGNPAMKHKSLPPFPPELFRVWLKLFEETVKELYEENQAEQFIGKSENIARSLMYFLYPGS